MFNNALHAIDSSIIAEWPLENSLNDLTRNVNDLIANGIGGVTFSPNNNMPIGKYTAGPYSTTNYLMAPTKFNTLFASTGSAWTMTCYVKFSVLDGGVVLSFYNNNDFTQIWTMRVLATGALRVISNNTSFGDSAIGVLTTGEWYFIAWTSDGVTLKGYASKANIKSSNSSVCSTSVPASVVNVTNFRIGEEGVPGLEFPLNGFVKDVKVYNKVLTSFPGA